MGRRKPSRQWRRWHRWLGLALVAPIVVLSVTGILLNHLDRLSWAAQPLPPFLARWYGASVPEKIPGLTLNGRGYAHAHNTLFIEAGPALYCQSPFRGVVALERLNVAGCANELLMMTSEGQEIERLGAGYGVPPYQQLGYQGEKLVLETAGGLVVFDVNQLGSERLDNAAAWQRVALGTPPAALSDRVKTESVPPSLDWERLLLDLHAGRVLGTVGPWLLDLVALIMLALGLTGLVIWWRSR